MNLPLAPLMAMILVVVASNWLVQFPINDLLTWGAITYPFSFLITDVTTRLEGPQRARRVVWVGFALAVLLSIWLATPRIALASGTAFLVGQLLDIQVFQRLRDGSWWRAPLVSSTLGSVVDTALFFTPRLRRHRCALGLPGHGRPRGQARARGAGPGTFSRHRRHGAAEPLLIASSRETPRAC